MSSATCPPDAPLVSPLERATFLLPEWETSIRLQDNIEWVVENVEAYWDNVDVVFMMGYGRLLATENVPFHDALVSKSNGEWADKLLVYARRASGTDTDVVGGNENFIELRVAAEWPIMEVTVRTRGKDAPSFKFWEAVAPAAGEEEEI